MGLLKIPLVIADFLGVFVVFFSANLISGSDPSVLESPFVASLGCSLLALVFLNFGRAYDHDIPFVNSARNLFVSWIGYVFFILFLLFITKTSAYFSRSAAVAFFTLGFTWIFLNHFISWVIYKRLRKMGVFSRKVIVIGTPAELKSLKAHVDNFKEHDFEIIEYLSVSEKWNPTKKNRAEIEKLVRARNEKDVREIVIAMDWHAPGFSKLLKVLRQYPYDLKLFPSEIITNSPDFCELSMFLGLPVLGIERRPLNSTSLLLKMVEDYLFSLLCLIIASPFLILISLLIRMEGAGPIFFRQSRYGYNGHEFKILKFRTMKHVINAEDTSKQATKNDPRFTRTGKFLRRTSLDEIPQFLNVLKGEMSIVGPRPHPVVFDKEIEGLIPGYITRQKIKPGITGWAQINGLRGETKTLAQLSQRIDYDVYYINNWSLLFDIKIIFLTIFHLISSENSY